MSHVLLIEDDASIREVIELGLSTAEITVTSAGGGAEALALLSKVQPDVILLDLRMPEMDGAEFARVYAAQGGRVPLIVMSAAGDANRAAAGVTAAAVLQKPFDLEQLLRAVKDARKVTEPTA